MVGSIAEFEVESLAVSRGSVTHIAPDDRERTPTSMTPVGPVERIGTGEDDVRVPVPLADYGVTDEDVTVAPVSNENVGSGRTNGVVAT